MECGECTLCCKLLELHEIPSPIGVYCEQCDHGKGCMIYDGKPEECKTYQCMWLQMENAGEELRPDKCGIIFDRASKDVITARLEEGKMLNDLTFSQVSNFNDEGFSVLIFRGDEMRFFLTDGHTQEHVLDAVHERAHLGEA